MPNDEPEGFIGEIATRIKQAVRPRLGIRGNDVEFVGGSGDAEFKIDLVAEQVIAEIQKEHNGRFSYYSEARGLVPGDKPEWLLIIDPIDGTRPARAGFEQCVVSVAALHATTNPVLGSVTHACVASVKSDWVANLGPTGLTFENWELPRPPKRRSIVRVPDAAWAFEICGRYPPHVFEAISPIVRRSSVTGGVFCFNSSAFSLVALAAGQLDAFVDVGGVIAGDPNPDIPKFGLMAYDIAAAVPIALAAGAVVTDAHGRSIDDVPLLEVGADAVLSCVAACTPELHAEILSLLAGT